MADVLLLSRPDLEQTLDFSSVIEAMDAAFRAESLGQWDTPKRIQARTEAGGLLAMPSAGGAPEALGAKLVTTFSGNSRRGLPGVAGLYALFDPETGEPWSVMDGAYLTLVRTAAVSALATRRLARADASSLGVLGAGPQAEFHVRLIATVRPIDHVVLWARREEAADAAIARLRARDDLGQVSRWTVARAPEEASVCDVVVTATAALEPVVRGVWLREGSHVNAIGAHTKATREIDSEAVSRAQSLAVETADTLAEAGDFQMAHQETGDVLGRVMTLGRLLVDAAPTRRDARSLSIFKSCGVAFEDLAVASLAFKRARELTIGAPFSFA